MNRINFFAALLVALPLYLTSERTQSAEPMPIYVSPFYNSDGPEVNVGKFSDKLRAKDEEALAKTVVEMKSEFGRLPIEAMYVAAVRLYDIGLRDEAVYWFYSAQYRARLYKSILDPKMIGGIGSAAFELSSAFGAFHQLSGPFINGYAFCSQETLLKTLDRVKSEIEELPEFAHIYPEVAFIPAESWPEKAHVSSEGLATFAAQVSAKWNDIQSSRKENGMDEKFCR